MVEIGGEHPHRPGTGLAIRQRPDADADVGDAVRAREDPAVAGEGIPAGLFPQRDHREVDELVHIGAHRESPEHPRSLDQAGALGHVAGGTVGTDHEVGPQFPTVTDGEAFELTVRPEGAIGPPDEGDGACVEGGGAQGVVEHPPGDGPSATRVGHTVAAGEDDPPAGGAHDRQVADIEPGRFR